MKNLVINDLNRKGKKKMCFRIQINQLFHHFSLRMPVDSCGKDLKELLDIRIFGLFLPGARFRLIYLGVINLWPRRTICVIDFTKRAI